MDLLVYATLILLPQVRWYDGLFFSFLRNFFSQLFLIGSSCVLDPSVLQPSTTISTPGDSNVVFIVGEIVNCPKTKENPLGIEGVIPLGTSFALTETFVFTACHNVILDERDDDGNEEEGNTKKRKKQQKKDQVLSTIALMKEFDRESIFLGDIIVASLVSYCSLGKEDWAVYERTSGIFPHYAHVCPSAELPEKNTKIGIRDCPVGLWTVGASSKITVVESFGTKVSNYQTWEPPTSPGDPLRPARKMLRVVNHPKPPAEERVIQVVGGRINRSCGAGYFAPNNKIVAFHFESVNDEEEIASAVNSTESTSSHFSFGHGLVLCRLTAFRKWYNNRVVKELGIAKL